MHPVHCYRMIEKKLIQPVDSSSLHFGDIILKMSIIFVFFFFFFKFLFRYIYFFFLDNGDWDTSFYGSLFRVILIITFDLCFFFFSSFFFCMMLFTYP